MATRSNSFIFAAIVSLGAIGLIVPAAQASDADLAAKERFGLQSTRSFGPDSGLHAGRSRPDQTDPYDYDSEHR